MRVVGVARVAEGERDIGRVIAHRLNGLGRFGLEVAEPQARMSALHAPISRGTTVDDADGNAAMRTRPVRSPASSASSSAAESIERSTVAAWRARMSPASVSTTPRANAR